MLGVPEPDPTVLNLIFTCDFESITVPKFKVIKLQLVEIVVLETVEAKAVQVPALFISTETTKSFVKDVEDLTTPNFKIPDLTRKINIS